MDPADPMPAPDMPSKDEAKKLLGHLANAKKVVRGQELEAIHELTAIVDMLVAPFAEMLSRDTEPPPAPGGEERP